MFAIGSNSGSRTSKWRHETGAQEQSASFQDPPQCIFCTLGHDCDNVGCRLGFSDEIDGLAGPDGNSPHVASLLSLTVPLVRLSVRFEFVLPIPPLVEKLVS